MAEAADVARRSLARGTGLVWYAVQVRPHQRQVVGDKYRTNPADAPFVVEHLLQRKGFATYVPRKKVYRFANKVARAKRQKVARAFQALPGWMFVGWPAGENRWRDLFDTRGVSGVAGDGQRPLPIAEASIRRLSKQWGGGFLTAPEYERFMPTYKEYAPGSVARITEGNLADVEVIVIEVERTGVARVIMSLFGKDHELAIDAMLLEAA